MKRKVVNLGCMLVSAACLLGSAWEGWQWREALQLNRAIAAASTLPGSAAAESPRAPAAVRLARAVALARAGQDDAAVKLYTGLARVPDDALAQAALYDLANLYLRQGSADATPTMLELAKQRYRDVLHMNPLDWDARYNLERALRLAPEDVDAYTEHDTTPAEQRRVTLRGMAAGDLP